MTIRDHIKRQFWKMAATLLVPLAAFEVLIRHMPNFSLDSGWVWLVGPMPLVLLVFIVWSFYQAAAIVCPRCAAGLTIEAAAICAGRRFDHCPKCRVSLDAPLSE